MADMQDLYLDSEYQKALTVTLSEKVISSKFIQEKLGVSSKIAMHLVFRLEKNKIVSKEYPDGTRKVLAILVTSTYKNEIKRKNLFENIKLTIHGIIMLSILGFLLYGVVSCVFSPETEEQKMHRESREINFRYAILCQDIAIHELKFPSKADLKDLKWNWDKDKQNFYVYGEYEAMNNFGAMIPRLFNCTYDKDFNLIQFTNQ